MAVNICRVVTDPARIYYLPVRALKGVFVGNTLLYAVVTYVGRAFVHNFNNIWAILAVAVVTVISYRLLGFWANREPNLANLFFAKLFMRRQRAGLANADSRLVVFSP